jgi:glycosyltransferase involved in cell wall biosynthesis
MVTSFFGAASFGGDAVYIERLGDALIKRGHEVHVICSAGAFRCVQGRHQRRFYQPPSGLRVHTIAADMRGVAGAIWSHQTGRIGPVRSFLSQVLGEVPFDVVHLHNVSLLGHTHILELIPAGRRPVKLVTAHDYWWICPQSLLWKNNQRVCDGHTCVTCLIRSRRPPQLWRGGDFAPRALARADAVLFPSQAALDIHLAHGLRHPHMEVLPCFLPDEWTTHAPAAPPSERPYFAAVGRLVTEKDFQAIVPVMREFPGLDLRLAGSGPLEPQLRALATDLPNVKLLGQLSSADVAGLLRGARALIVPSLFPETFGYVAAEAMALGTPVIARRRGALPEVVQTAGGGLLFESSEELRAHMQTLAFDETRRKALVVPERARHLWSESAHIDQYLQIVETLQ